MYTITDTIQETIFKNKELLKNLNAEREVMLMKLLSKQQVINQVAERTFKLEAELKELYNQQHKYHNGSFATCDSGSAKPSYACGLKSN